MTLIFWSGATEATAGLAASDCASAGVTVAANDATALYPITLVPPAAFTCEITGDSVAAGRPDWLARMTMTGDAALVAAPAGDVVAALAVAAPPRAHASDTPAARPMTCWVLLMDSFPRRRCRTEPAAGGSDWNLRKDPRGRAYVNLPAIADPPDVPFRRIPPCVLPRCGPATSPVCPPALRPGHALPSDLRPARADAPDCPALG